MEPAIARWRSGYSNGTGRIVITKHAEYLEQAEFCRAMADRSPSPERKAEWLRLAKLWLSLPLSAAPRSHDPVLQAIIRHSRDKSRE